jgi:hypothetical protein
VCVYVPVGAVAGCKRGGGKGEGLRGRAQTVKIGCVATHALVVNGHGGKVISRPQVAVEVRHQLVRTARPLSPFVGVAVPALGGVNRALVSGGRGGAGRGGPRGGTDQLLKGPWSDVSRTKLNAALRLYR